MRIAVVNEVSARDKNPFILGALEAIGLRAHNIGMRESGEEAELTYIHTGLMAALALDTGAADLVVGGCGTGQGFLLSVMQYPGVYCGLITNPLEAFLFSQINAGNCVSLALNKGFGWAGDINLRYIFEKLLCETPGGGYPPHRSESQRASRQTVADISKATHRDMASILRSLDRAILERAFGHRAFADFIAQYAGEGEVKGIILGGA